ncbi:MAG: hypothetical protein ACREUF_08275, partial [Solimonas sp.]
MVIEQVKQAHEMEWMRIPGVEGVGIGQDELGNPSILIYVSSKETEQRLPKSVAGHRIQAVNLGAP